MSSRYSFSMTNSMRAPRLSPTRQLLSRTSSLSLNNVGRGDDDDNADDDDDCRELTLREVQEQLTRLQRYTTSLKVNTIASVTAPDGWELTTNMCVALDDGSFLYVKEVGGDDGETIRGILLWRTHKLHHYLNNKRNEVCAILKTPDNMNSRDVPDPLVHECSVDRPLSSVKRPHQIVFTNREFPAHSWRGLDTEYESEEEFNEKAPLVCRWKYTEFCDLILKKPKVVEHSLVKLSAKECTPGKATPDSLLKKIWRDTMPLEQQEQSKKASKDEEITQITKGEFASSSKGKKRAHDFMDLTNADSDIEEPEPVVTQRFKRTKSAGINERGSQTTARSQRQFIFGDVCAGAGGMTSGARMSGMRIKFLLDHCRNACNTLALNNPTATIYKKSIFDVFSDMARHQYDLSVDVMNISYPCKYWSSAHTRPGAMDEANIAAIYSVGPIFNKCRPRVVTLEQVPNIKNRDGGVHFNALINQVTSQNYSVRWRVLNLAEYENAQARKRLILIASCPGERLPKYPEPTHGPGGLPFTTIRQILSQIDYTRIEPHMRAFTPKIRRPHNANQPLPHCMTTKSDEDDLHPNGMRSFNLRERACLNGFSPTHRFPDCGMTNIRALIGDAVPGGFAKLLFKEIVKTMRESDRLEDEQGDSTDVIEID